MNDFEFEFTVEGMTQEQAHKLLELILETVEGMGLRMGGGFSPVSDQEVGNG